MAKTMRRCSICRMPGHTKLVCDLKKHADEREHSGAKHRSRSVLVNVEKDQAKSPHVVNLRVEKKDSNLSQVPVFSESRKTTVRAGVLPVADSVKRANAEVAREWKTRMESVHKILEQGKKTLYRKPFIKPVARIEKMGVRSKLSTTEEVLPVEKIVWQFTLRRKVFAAVAGILIVALPLPSIGYYHKLKDVNGIVVSESTQAFLALQASTVAALRSDIPAAEAELGNALAGFAKATSLIDKEYHGLISLAKLIPVVGTQVTSRQDLLLAGHHLALGNTYIVKGIGEMETDPNATLTDRLSVLRRHLTSSLPQYKEALNRLATVDTKAIPTEYQQPYAEFSVLFGTFVNDIEDLIHLTDAFENIFGSDSFRRYLVVFQNNHELRPTGGFMGSFAVVDVQKGKILNIDVPGGGTYDLQGQLGQYVKPPLPLQLVNKRWEFQDANWFPDFAATAKKMAWFYENARGSTVDGVIAINASVLERVLSVMGPLENKEYGLLLDHNSVLDDLQYEVEIAYDKEENKPKAVLSSLLDQLLGAVGELDPGKLVHMLGEIHTAASQKEIQVYVEDERVHQELREFGWTGELVVENEAQDYLNIIHANVQGQKSDAKIDQEIVHQAVVAEDGSITDTVVIRRTHNGERGEQFYGVTNISYVRAYVPAGAELIAAEGFTYPPEEAFKVPESWYEDDPDLRLVETGQTVDEASGTVITREFSKTSFGNWVVTGPGETSEVSFTYKLPFNIPVTASASAKPSRWQKWLDPEYEVETSRYSLIVQKQSGLSSDFSSALIYPNGWTPVWRNDNDIELALNGATYDAELNTDRVLGVVFEKHPQYE